MWAPSCIPALARLISWFFPLPLKKLPVSNWLTMFSWWCCANWSLLLQEALTVLTIKVVMLKKSNTEEQHLATETTTSWNWCAKQCIKKACGFSSNIHICNPWNSSPHVRCPSYLCPRILEMDNPWKASIPSKAAFRDDDVMSATSFNPRNLSITSPWALTYLHSVSTMVNKY